MKKTFAYTAAIIGVVFLLIGAKITSDTLRLGNKAPEDISIIFDNGTAPYPIVGWNQSAGKVQFSNDGVNFFFVDAEGAPLGLNLLANPGFESGLTSWAATDGSFATTVAAGEVGYGGKSVKWDTLAATNTVKSDLAAVPNILQGQTCLARINYLWDSGNLTDLVLRVDNEAAAALTAEIDLPVTAAGVWKTLDLEFNCPSSGSVRIVIKSNADAAEITLDQMHIGNDIRGEIPDPLTVAKVDSSIEDRDLDLCVNDGGVEKCINIDGPTGVVTSDGTVNVTLADGTVSGGAGGIITDGTILENDLSSVFYEVQEKDLDNNFTAGRVAIERIGRTVTISSVVIAAGTSATLHSTSSGFVPASMRPATGSGAGAVCYITTTTLYACYVFSDGTFRMQYMDIAAGGSVSKQPNVAIQFTYGAL